MGPSGMLSDTLKIWAPPSPIRFIASRSAVIPSRVMFPFIQCHQVWGRADAGGLWNPAARSSCAAANGTNKAITNATEHRNSVEVFKA